MEAKYVKFKLLINISETQLIKNYFMWQYVLIVKKNIYLFNENYFPLKLFRIFSFKINSTGITPDPNWAKILDPDPNSMYLDPPHWLKAYYLWELEPGRRNNTRIRTRTDRLRNTAYKIGSDA